MSRATKAATLLACLTLTAGCSGSSPSATTAGANLSNSGADSAAGESALTGLSALQVWEKTKADADAARSVQVRARFLDGDQQVAINLRMTDAEKAYGWLKLNGNKVRVRRLGSTLYVNGDTAFWTANADAATATALANKWIMVKRGSSVDLEQFFELTDMDLLVADIMSLSVAEQKELATAPGIKIGKRRTVGLADETAGDDSDFQMLYVWAHDPALPLNLILSADETQYMKFRRWDQDFTVTAPAGAIDLNAADPPG